MVTRSGPSTGLPPPYDPNYRVSKCLHEEVRSTQDLLDRQFAALADATRRDLLTRLRQGPATVTELAGHYPMTRAGISQHLTVLEKAELLTRTRRGKWVECHLTQTGLDQATAWLEAQRAEWDDRLDRLEDHLNGHSPSTTDSKEATDDR